MCAQSGSLRNHHTFDRKKFYVYAIRAQKTWVSLPFYRHIELAISGLIDFRLWKCRPTPRRQPRAFIAPTNRRERKEICTRLRPWPRDFHSSTSAVNKFTHTCAVLHVFYCYLINLLFSIFMFLYLAELNARNVKRTIELQRYINLRIE